MSIVILAVSFLMLSATPVHCNASSVSEPSFTYCTPHCSLLFTYWLALLCSTLVPHFVTFPPETSATHITLDIPRHGRPLLQLILLVGTQAITISCVPLPSMESHFKPASFMDLCSLHISLHKISPPPPWFSMWAWLGKPAK